MEIWRIFAGFLVSQLCSNQRSRWLAPKLLLVCGILAFRIKVCRLRMRRKPKFNLLSRYSRRKEVVDCWLLTVNCWLLTVNCWLLTVDCWLFAIFNPYVHVKITLFLLPSSFFLLPFTYTKSANLHICFNLLILTFRLEKCGALGLLGISSPIR